MSHRKEKMSAILRELNAALSDYTQYDDDRWGVISDSIRTFHSMPAVQSYRSHRAEVDEWVVDQPDFDEFLNQLGSNEP